jgi:hypothetical protein
MIKDIIMREKENDHMLADLKIDSHSGCGGNGIMKLI